MEYTVRSDAPSVQLRCIHLEIESFAQCLAYISATAKEKSSLEMLIAPAASLVGIVIGFLLNHLRDKGKSRREAENKLMCVNEDVMRTMQATKHVFKEVVRLYDFMNVGRPDAHNLPSEINTPYIDHHFVGIAHLLTQEQRHRIVSTLPSIKELNVLISNISNFHDTAATDVARDCKNAASQAIFCIDNCGAYFSGKKDAPSDWVSMADDLGVSSHVIEELRQHGLREPAD